MSTVSSIPILLKWEQYIQIEPAGSVEGFAQWIMGNELKPDFTLGSSRNNSIEQDDIDRAAQVAILINRLQKLMGFFNKPLIRKMGFAKEHEFAVFTQVAISDKLNKKELANKTLLEVSTTVEITKRLAKKGLIKEQVDKADRRASRISLSEKGRKLLMNNANFFAVHLKEFVHAITEEEQKTLIDLLTRLNADNSTRYESLQTV